MYKICNLYFESFQVQTSRLKIPSIHNLANFTSSRIDIKPFIGISDAAKRLHRRPARRAKMIKISTSYFMKFRVLQKLNSTVNLGV